MDMHRRGQIGGTLRSARQLIREVQLGGRDKRAADPRSGDHLNQAGVRLAVYICMTTEDPTLTAALFAFLLLSQRVIQPLIQIAMSLNQWDDARIAIEAIGDLVNRPEEEGRSREGPRPTVHGKIEFQNVTFTYRDTSTPALREVSFAVPAGTTLGLVGRSGSGKTTVTRLLQRLSPGYQGQILIDGVELRDCVPGNLCG